MKILHLNGKTYKLAELLEIQQELLNWAKPKLPDPVEDIKATLKDFSPRIQEIMIKDAMQQRRTPKSIDTPEVQGQIKTPEGLNKTLELTYRKHQPEMTVEDCWEVHSECAKQYGDWYSETILPTEKELQAVQKSHPELNPDECWTLHVKAKLEAEEANAKKV